LKLVVEGEVLRPGMNLAAWCRKSHSRKWLCLAESELKEDFRNPVIVQEVLEAARDYAKTIFGDDFCMEWESSDMG
jgi:hypothetical protein